MQKINQLGNRILQNAMNNPDKVGKYVNSVAKGKDTNKAFVVYQKGEPVTMYLNDGMLEGFSSLGISPSETNALIKGITNANTLFKQLVTSYNPAFIVKNFTRDLGDVLGLYSTDSGKFIKNYPKAVGEIKKKR